MYDKKEKDFEGIIVENLQQGISGLTYPHKPYKVLLQKLDIKYAANNTLRGRIAYALFEKIASDARMPLNVLKIKMAQAMGEGKKSSKVSAFVTSKPEDYFAEAFDDYYHSPKSRQFIKNELPTTFKLLTSVLVKPHWLYYGAP